MQAQVDGYDDMALLTSDGKVSEGTGQNVLVVPASALIAGPVIDGILDGIIRDSAIHLVRRLEIQTMERAIDRTEL